MATDIELQLMATPTLQLPNIGPGSASTPTEGQNQLYSVPRRRVLAATGKAMKDGSFPIPNVAYLRKAVQAYGRAKDKPKAKRWIIRRARELKRTDLLPETWGVQNSDSVTAAAHTDTAPPSTPAGNDVQNNGVMVAVYPPLGVAQALAGTSPGDLPAEELHVTLAYLGTVDELGSNQIPLIEDVLNQVSANFNGLTAKVQGVGTFLVDEDDSGDNANPRWFSVDSVGLAELRTEIISALEDADIQLELDHDFTPHMTIRYGGAMLPEEIPAGGEVEWPINSIFFVVGSNKKEIPLTPLADTDEGEQPENVSLNSYADTGTVPQQLPAADAQFVNNMIQHHQAALAMSRKAAPNVSDPRVKKLIDSIISAQTKEVALMRGWLGSDTAVPSPGTDMDMNAVDEYVKAPGPCSLDRSSKYNWVEQEGGLPNYICQVARAVERGGRTLESAIPIAIGTMKNWVAGKGNVSAGVRARAAAALAEWEAMKARAKARPNQEASLTDVEFSTDDLIEIELFTELSVSDMEEWFPMGTGDGSSTMNVADVAGWGTEFEYFWDRKGDRTYRVLGDVTQSFNGSEWGADERPAVDVRTLPSVTDVDTLHALVAAAMAQESGVSVVPPEAGRRFRIPLVIPEGVPSGDRRLFVQGALEFKEPPMPLLWQRETDDGHKNSITVGKIEKIERLETGGLGNAEGVFDTHADAVEAARQVRERFLTGVSGDVDQFEHELSQDENGRESLTINHARLVAATLVAKPAFQEATIEIIPEDGDQPVVVASAGPIFPPKAWFDNPRLDGPTMMTVTDDGRVFGHIAAWDTPHTANPNLRPPRNSSGYRYFNRKPLRTAEGEDICVGQLTLVGGHADLSLDPDRAASHYDDTRSAVADVRVGEDEYGIWCAGAMRSNVSPEQIRAFRASEPSGDWRMRDGKMELLAVCQVNSAGFPVQPRALVASSGEVLSLVAAGMVGHRNSISLLERRVDELTSLVDSLVAARNEQRRTEMQNRILAALRSDAAN